MYNEVSSLRIILFLFLMTLKVDKLQHTFTRFVFSDGVDKNLDAAIFILLFHILQFFPAML